MAGGAGFFLWLLPGWGLAQEPFARDFPPTFSYTDSYEEGIVTTVEEGESSSEVMPKDATSEMKISAKLSMTGIDPAALDGTTSVEISVGSFSFSGMLMDDPAYYAGKTSAQIRLVGPDYATGEDVNAGVVTLTWSGSALNLAVSARYRGGYSIDAANYEGADGEIAEEGSCSVRFADRILEDRIVYVTGSASVRTKTVGTGDSAEEFELSTVKTSGAIDSTRPRVAMDTPAKAVVVNEPVIDLAGTATDNIAVESVEVAVNGEDPIVADFSEGVWSLAAVALQPGDNTISVRALDLNGNDSMPVTRAVSYLTPIVVTVVGKGTVTKGYLGTSLRVPDSTQTIASAPAPGWLFAGWSGSVSATTSQLEFSAAPGTTLQALFVPTQFEAGKGRYLGVLETAAGFESGGRFSANLRPNGTFTAQFDFGGRRQAMRGTFDEYGTFSTTLERKGAPSLSVVLQLGTSNGLMTIHGTVSDGTNILSFSSERSAYSAAAPAPQAGMYTVLLPADANHPELPQGDGFGRLTVSRKGVAKLVGILGDGVAFSASAPLGHGGALSIFARPYRNGGVLVGKATFQEVTDTSDLDATLDWVKPANDNAPSYPGGFSTKISLVGSRYVVPAADQPILTVTPVPGNAQVTIEAGGLTAKIEKLVMWSSANRISVPEPNPEKLTVRLIPATGLYSGAFLDAATGRSRTFKGAVLQKQNLGSGVFVAVGESGSVSLTVRKE